MTLMATPPVFGNITRSIQAQYSSAEPFIENVTFPEFILFILVIVLTFIVGAVVSVSFARYLKTRTSEATAKTASKFLMYGLYALGLFIAFHYIIDFNISASLAALGILGIAIIFPMIPILQNFASGILLSIERPMQEEDIVEFQGELCRVKSVGLRKTVLQANSGKIVIIPNLVYMNLMPIINYSKGEFIKVKIPLSIDPKSSLEDATAVVQQILKDHPSVLPNIPKKKQDKITMLLEIPANFFSSKENLDKLTPKVHITHLSKDKLNLDIIFWTWDIMLKETIVSQVLEKVRVEFEKKGIVLGVE